ncbi:33 kDa chaperonin [Candidatus Competibacter denitrificans Run_A_D11]|uniref:33 kDa chaperonin n=1 Tax=Candidatus Competibacter denitrificans Run_A_D11 TaxID=1400863 RepID=W6M4G6_9GAMM|nr:Hsp33 family molecular chaperone HslO [Candidatus Competibacter denitrificans]CDI01504.1 33 kDa chaperonin [Candidatus Competibacter denitrificans Run_A_D11]HRC68562.1 Hsp33 family molecular chaperone HslO [Candidatus Competibacter denitrificans]
MADRDSLHRFLFDHLAVRGEIVHLDTAWRAVLERRTYPPAVQEVLGAATAAAALLSATIKFDGLLTLQIQARGPLRLVVVQVTSQRTLRALARWDGEPEPQPLQALCGDGTLLLTIDIGQGREPYQGVVDLCGNTLAEALEDYFDRSEQLPTRILLAANERTAAGLLLQRLPDAITTDADGWKRINILAATLQPAELLALNADTLLYQLFHEEDVRVFKPQAFSYRCTCSRERTAAMLYTLGTTELRQAADEEGALHVDCEFCGYRYAFDTVDIAGLLASASPSPSITRH